MKVLELRFLSNDEEYDLESYNDGAAWSRIYEYKLAEQFLKEKMNKESRVHNSAWGYEGIHIVFRKKIDEICSCLHSDIVPNKHNLFSYKYNLLTVDEKLLNKFDCVLNISVLEHLGGFENTKKAILNLYDQVKVGGYLYCTFDYPRVDLKELEKMLNVRCIEPESKLNGSNSKQKNDKYSNLNIVLLIIKKEEDV
tara:strand:+ start:4892 stop:5479 length:588 start_codon:yes stop_codon:yes gene_type:complete